MSLPDTGPSSTDPHSNGATETLPSPRRPVIIGAILAAMIRIAVGVIHGVTEVVTPEVTLGVTLGMTHVVNPAVIQGETREICHVTGWIITEIPETGEPEGHHLIITVSL